MADERVARQVAGERCWARLLVGRRRRAYFLSQGRPGLGGRVWTSCPPCACGRDVERAQQGPAYPTRILPELPRLTPQTVKKLPVMQENRVRSLGSEEPLEKGVAPTLVFLPGEFMDIGT